jgi:hypothetical protein
MLERHREWILWWPERKSRIKGRCGKLSSSPTDPIRYL